VIRADVSKIRNEIGWRPQRTLDQTLIDTLEYWRQALTSETVLKPA